MTTNNFTTIYFFMFFLSFNSYAQWDSEAVNTSLGRLDLGDFSDGNRYEGTDLNSKLRVNKGGILVRNTSSPFLTLGLDYDNLNRRYYASIAIASSKGAYSQLSNVGDAVFRSGGFRKNIVFSNTGGGDYLFGIGTSSQGHTEGMRFTRDGDLGIGTATPQDKLHLDNLKAYQGLTFASKFKIRQSGITDNNFVMENIAPNGNLYLRSRIEGNTIGNLILNDKGGNVGIGTTNPQHKLDVNTGAGSFKTYKYGAEHTVNTSGGWARSIRFRNEADNSTVTFGGHSGSAFISTGTYSDPQSANSVGYNNKRFTVDKNGNVGIGTTAVPSEKLEVRGHIRVNSNKNYSVIKLGKEANDAIFADNKGDGYYGNGYWFRVHDEDHVNKYRDVMMLTDKGNVGIDTTTPTEKLDVNGNAKIGDNNWAGLTLNGKGENDWLLNAHNDGQRFYFRTQKDDDSPNSNIVMTMLRNSARVGIGTVNPKSKLQVNGKITIGIADNAVVHSIESGVNVNGTPRTLRFNHSSIIENEGFEFFNTVLNKQLMFIEGSGNVGIGTSDTKGFKLGVNGNIAATEVKVALYQNWPDYVFKADYKLPTLEEVENHINEKGHLENIPSAAEIEEEGGIFIGEMNLKLLEKIEELTLYTIAQEKKIQAIESSKYAELEKLKEKSNLQDQKIELLLSRLDKLEASKW